MRKSDFGLKGTLLWACLLALTHWFSPSQAAPPTQGLLREVYENIGGNAVSDLTNSPSFPDKPTSTNYISIFEAPTDVLESYGQRVRGYVLPPTSGEYIFWIASDDNSALFLSTDESPANRLLIARVDGWTSSREWEKESGQRSAPVTLEGGRRYYVEALMKEGGGGDNLAVRWQLPSGAIEEPIPGNRLAPIGTALTPPVITQDPVAASALEGGTAFFEVRVANLDPLSYQWQRNGAAIPGATGARYTLAAVAQADNGAVFRCVLSNILGTATSAGAVLTVAPDTTPPDLVGVQNVGTTLLTLTFSEAVSVPTDTPSNYFSIDAGVSVLAVAAGADSKTLVLTTSPMTYGGTYQLSVTGVRDRAATPNASATPSKRAFVATEYAPVDIGGATGTASTVAIPGGYQVSASGSGVGGSSDQFHFEYQQRTGNFDVVVRVAAFTANDPWAVAGLMARETLAANARFAAALATPSTVGCFMMTRAAAPSTATSSGSFPVNYPQTWLRLQRVGTAFKAFASIDGRNWQLLGSSTLSLPSTIYLGTSLASRSVGALASARLVDLAPAAGGVIGSFAPVREQLGPSSRHTGLVISEIMYHPRERGDGKVLEFVELFNAGLIFEDLSGGRLAGAVDFEFPKDTILWPGAWLVVAKVPEDIKAVYGVGNVLGGYTGGLQNSSGTVMYVSRGGAVQLEARYSGATPWPAAADGAGHSLVLSRPSHGEASPLAWSASESIGGSPGTLDTMVANPHAAVRINEFLAHTDDPQLDFVELYNHSNDAVDLGGCILTDDPRTNKFVLPPGTSVPARGFLSFDQNQLGFSLNAAGESIFLINPGQTRVIDSVRYEAQENGVATGRWPDGADTFRRLSRPTPGSANAGYAVSDVVINEIMHSPISGDKNDEYVELFNRGTSAVNLSGWKFVDGIDYKFGPNTTLAAGGYLVVARDSLRLMSRYPNLNAANTVGDYSGSLGSGSTRLALAMPDTIISTNSSGLVTTNKIDIVVEEVAYEKGGRWGMWADGGGSSLELIDPNSDHLRPSNWADSDETAKAPWTTVEFTGVLDNGNTSYPPNSLQMHLLGGGECLVDDVEVFKVGSTNLLANPSFDGGINGWVIQGNHRASALEPGTGVGGTSCLHLRTTGRGDTGANRIRSTLTSGTALRSGNTATLRAKVRWLRGFPEILLRLRGNWLEAAGALTVPTNLGTPGAPNSRAVPNAGPAIYEVSHSPALPADRQSVRVTARFSDPQGVTQPTLRHRLDPTTTYNSVNMVDDGSAGDEIAGDGLYTATISGRPAGTLVAFYIQTTDLSGGSTTVRFPDAAPSREALIRWGENQPVGNLGAYHLWQTQANVNKLNSRESLANDPLDATFVYNDARVVYNINMRGKGSPFHGGSIGGDYLLAFPEDNLLLGDVDFAIVTVGNLGSDDSAQREQDAYWIARELDIPYLHRRHIHFFVNGERKGSVYEDAEEPNSHFLKAWYPGDSNGDLHKIEDWFEFDDNATGFSNIDATLQKFTTTGGAIKLARYRWDWRKRAVQDSASNYTNLFNLVNAVNATDTGYTQKVLDLADIEQWMRVFAVEHTVGNWDAYGYGRGKNMYAYKPANGRWSLTPWDIDFVLGSGSDSPTTDVFGVNDPVIGRMYGHPPFLRAYWRAYQDLVNGPLQKDRIGPVVDGRRQGLVANGVNVPSAEPIKNWVESRRVYLASRLAAVATTFAITSNSGRDFTSTTSLLALTGTAPVEVATMEFNGIQYPVTWTDVRTWSVKIPLTARATTLEVRGYDLRGREVPGAVDSIKVLYNGNIEEAKGYLVINEIMYHAVASDASYVEIFNSSPGTTFDLSNWRLDGAGFTFPEGTLIGPNAYLLVAKKRTAFAAAYGAGIPVAGEFSGSLSNGGETLRLVSPGATPEAEVVVAEVKYNDKAPWPTEADGLGSSLQLIDPKGDNFRVGNWGAAPTNAPVRFTPGQQNSLRATLDTFPALWINELLPSNVNGIADRFGHVGPWIELHNSGASAVDLSGYYLTDQTNALTKWQFPPQTSIAAGQFLVLWADGDAFETTVGEIHTNFRLGAPAGFVALSRLQSGNPAVMDFVQYANVGPGRSYGSHPDGQLFKRQIFQKPTPGAANDPASIPVQVLINEWMASNTRTLLNSSNAKYDDWFELFNAGSATVDLSGYALTDSLTNSARFVVPAGVSIPPQGYLLVWADGNTGGNTPFTGDLHVDFKLSKTGEEIGLLAPDGTVVDSVRFEQQTDDVSEGRLTDAAPPPFVQMALPTPRSANVVSTLNKPPVLAVIGSRTVAELQSLEFQAAATDADAGQSLTFSLGAEAPPGATMDAAGHFQWTPTEAQGPGVYTFAVRVLDNGTPPLSDFERITVTVSEVNSAPETPLLASVTVNEGELLDLTVAASDADLPAQKLSFALATGAPAGMTVDAQTGLVGWTPSEIQAPGVYPVSVVVSDHGSPSLSATNSFQVSALEVNARPVIGAIPDQLVVAGETLSFLVPGSDPDLPAQALLYSLAPGAPEGAVLHPLSGRFTWKPSAAQTPSTNVVAVQLTDDGPPRATTTQAFRVIVHDLNHPPTLGPLPDLTVVEGTTLTQIVQGTDADAPGQTLRYAFESTPPAGMTLDPATGVLKWTPTESQGPSTNTLTIKVTDDGTPALSAFAVQTIVVDERNEAPTLGAVPDQTIRVGETLSLALQGSDQDLPANRLRYSLAPGAPGGVRVDAATGVLTWKPIEEEAFTTNVVKVVVSDDGVPPLSASQSFAVTVLPPSQWQFVSVTGTASSSVLYIYLNGAGTVNLDDLMLVAGDQAGVGSNVLTNSDFEKPLATGWGVSPNLSGSSIDQTSKRTGNSSLKLVSTVAGSTRGSSIFQDIAPALTANATYTLSYWYLPVTNEVALTIRLSGSGIQSVQSLKAKTNAAPVLAAISNLAVSEETPVSFRVQVTDADLPAQSLRFALDAGAPSGASIDPATGQFVWTPTEAQGPSNYNITVRVTDNGAPPASAARTFAVRVTEVNRAPVLVPMTGPVAATVGQLTTLAMVATDSDVPANRLIFSLDANVPAGAAIDPATGVFSWTPSSSQAGTTNAISIRVTDDGAPSLANALPITVIVAAPKEIRILEAKLLAGGKVQFSWSATAGQRFRVQSRDDLQSGSWTDAGDPLSAVGTTASFTVDSTLSARKFYRVVVEN